MHLPGSRRASHAEPQSRRSSVHHVVHGDAKTGEPPIAFASDKPGVIHSELYLTETGTKVEVVDYSGAHEKTDPKEIALVKKLDRWIMPTLWIMYWLNYL